MEKSSTAPLLTRKEEEEGASSSFMRDAWVECKMLWYVAGPAVLTTVFQYSLSSVTQTFAGHIGTVELAAVGIQNLVITGIAFGIMMGMGSALETLCGQAYGAGKLDMLGIYMQRSWVILFVTGLLISLVYIFTAPILKLLGQNDEIADMAGKYSIWMIPELFGFAINFPIQKFLQAQSKVMAMAWMSFASLVLHVLLSWVFIMKLEMGLVGAAITLNFSWITLVLAQLAYILAGSCKEAWTGFSWLAFTNLAGFVRLSVASAVMLCLEYWNLMVMILLAGLLKSPEIAVGAATICMNVEAWCMMIPFGFTAAISVRVSNELGAGRARAAKFSVVIVVMMSVIIQSIIVLVLMITRKDFPVIFTENKLVMEEVSKLTLFLSATIILSSIQPVLSGVAIGAGWQTTVAYINIGCYYIVGLPTAFLLGFKFNFGLEGIWSGMITGIALQTLILIVITWRTDWQKEAKLSKERLLVWGSSSNVPAIGSELGEQQ
ncbi:protein DETOXIFICATION 33-like [Magnolia sinica]|uniref:protein DETOXIFICATION 33-like n=1 Tax=Magnolia sinica TaxID=86752 RepID=UPI00265AFE0C|nr:protein DETOXIFICATION 33-like [Magnolia sinica]XP_058069621.1 protein DETOXIFICATION 33-like [Magnolia sinica]